MHRIEMQTLQWGLKVDVLDNNDTYVYNTREKEKEYHNVCGDKLAAHAFI